jgi:hypothetical protein
MELAQQLHQVGFSGALLARGSWLYVQEAVTRYDRTRLYVGRTGDSLSHHAQLPLTRLAVATAARSGA